MRIVVLGVGNDLRGDDAVGIKVAEKIKEWVEKNQEKDILVIATHVPENHVADVIKFAPRKVIVVDTADFMGKPGEFVVLSEDKISEFSPTTHNISLKMLAKVIKKECILSNPIFTFVLIQPKNVGFGEPMSSEVKSSIDTVTELVKNLITQI